MANTDTFTFTKSKKFLRKTTAKIMKVWVKRYVDGGDQVNIIDNDDELVFECPNRHTGFEAEVLCDIIHDQGYAKSLETHFRVE